MNAKQKKEAAKKFFTTSKYMGDWMLGIMEVGIDESDDGSCDIATENPEDARHAKALTPNEYAKALRDNFVKYLNTPKGLKNFAATMKKTHAALTRDEDYDHGE